LNRALSFAGIGLLAALAGLSLWLGARTISPRETEAGPLDITPAAFYSASFTDLDGSPRTLGTFTGKVLVVNFWATWCGPCREEMPGFARLQARWEGRGVQFVGLAHDEPEKVKAFSRDIGVNYPLWTGSSAIMEFSKRLGNRVGVLPHTVLVDREGTVLESRIGLFPEELLERRLAQIAAKTK
jgi:thiol-disulfide isomerase/thioredoxin